MRLIDADRLNEVLNINFGHTGGADVLRQLIDIQPTVQAVPIDVLDKIRAEIKQLPYQRIFGKVSNYSLIDVVIEIIDKYKAESEEV